MKKNTHLIYTLFFLLSTFTIAHAQEIVISTPSNPSLNTAQQTNFQKGLNETFLELPFFEDFSHGESTPRPSLWQDKDVFVNTRYAKDAPTVGFATFDLINSTGAIYDNAQYDFAFEADHLTSKPILLNNSDQNVILSFYYKPQGRADAPENKDSLLLDFFAPQEQKWHTVWAKAGTTNHDFKKVSITLTDEKYLQEGFQFRFRNWGSLGASAYASMAGNADQWHVDFIYLNRNRTENDIHDIAFTNSLNTMLKNYEAVPWLHYKSLSEDARTALMVKNIDIRCSNLGTSLRQLSNLKITFQDLSGLNPTVEIDAGSINLQAQRITSYPSLESSFTFPANNENTAQFLMSASFSSDFNTDSISNNTIQRKQIFDNYYAYDDGTAEAGYGLTGTGTKFGQVAYHFSTLKPDAIIGVEIYFCQTKNNASRKYFWLDVREKSKDGNYPSSETLYQVEGLRPEYESEINQFHYYPFPEPVYVTGDYYIGWTQTTDDLLNVGLDLNGNAKSQLSYNIGGGWQPSEINGALMIRPVFDGNFAPTKKAIASSSSTELPAQIGPNPVSEILYITLPSDYDTDKINLSVTNLVGKKVLNLKKTSRREINFSNFPKGIYLLEISAESGKKVRQKVIKQ